MKQILRIMWKKLPFSIRNSNFVRKIINRISRISTIKISTKKFFSARNELQKILRLNAGKPVMVIYPTYDWFMPLKQRPQHLATEFSNIGYLVFFCTSNFYDNVNGFEQIRESLFITNFYDKVLGHADLVVTYATDPVFSLQNLKKILRIKIPIIYDYLDEMHPDLNGHSTKNIVARQRLAFTSEQVVVVASAKSLMAQVKKVNPYSNVIYAPNACEYEHFSNVEVNKDSRVIGYFGALASWVDFELIMKLCVAFPNFQIRLIGYDYDGTPNKYPLEKFTNLSIEKQIAYDKLPAAIDFSIGILPFKVNEITLATSPIKVYEYLAMGLPVISSDLPECRNIPGVGIATSHDDFIKLIKEAIVNSTNLNLYAERKSYAQNQTWRKRAELINSALETILNN